MDLWLGDCLIEMARIADGSVDLILCDLPYGTTACKWDTVIPFDSLWAHYGRVIKPGGAIVLTAAQPFTSALVMSNPKWFRYEWIWEKSVGTGFLDANKRPLRCHENICIFYDIQPTYNPQKWLGEPNHGCKTTVRHTKSIHSGEYGRRPTDLSGEKYQRSVVFFAKYSSAENFHPTQKPVALMEYLIKTYTNKGELVLDNCMGSGTTGVACVNTGRRFIGIEKEPEYFRIASERVAAAQALPREYPMFEAA